MAISAAHVELAHGFLFDGKIEESRRHLGRALALNPAQAAAHFTLALLHAEQSERAEAALALRKAIVLAPYAAAAYNNLANLHERDGDFAGALGPSRRALLLTPADALFQANFASFCSKLDLAARAVRHYRASLALDPGAAKACKDFGIILAELGRRGEARQVFLRAIALAPRAVAAIRHCVELEAMAPDHPARDALARLARNQEGLSDAERSELNFTLGKSLADLGNTDAAFACWREANRLLRRLVPYDEAATMRNFDAVTAMFSAAAIEAARGQGVIDARPIFIIGMPRCGSTLVEQILASHPSIGASGENNALERMIERHGTNGYRAVGEAYLAELARLHPRSPRVTDKMLGNYLRLGFIAAALPEARIIHVHRDPVDTCLSNYSRLFVENHPYAADLGELGRYYRRYAALMEHWRGVLPPGRMLEVCYESVVEDLPAQLRRLLDFLDLPWDERCLAFHRTERFVRTASQSQVREPLYRSSVRRWHRYAAHIGPLIEALGPLAERHYMFGA